MIYEAQCKACRRVEDYVRPVAQCMETPECCGVPMQKVILTAPFGQPDIPAYTSPITGRWVNSRAQRHEDMRRSGSRPWEGMQQETKVAQNRAREAEKQSDAKIEQAAVAAWNQLAPEKRKVLEA